MRNEAIISVVDNDESVRTALGNLLRSSGFMVRTYPGSLEFLYSDGPAITTCLISDIQMPHMDGIQMYGQLTAMGINLPVIFISGNPDAQRKLWATSIHPIAFFPKPFPTNELIACIDIAIH